jgi:drug/metabolite transporter (DMT)-like permease
VLAVVLAALAAVLFAVGSVLQQRAAHASARLVLPHRRGRGRRLATLLSGSPTWLGGQLVILVGFACHASALHLGSLAVVQPVLALTLPASILIGGARGRHRPGAGDWAGIAALLAGVVLFLVVSSPSDGPPRPAWTLALASAVATGVSGLLALAATRSGPVGRALLLSTASSTLLALAAALTKAVLGTLTTAGLLAVVADWQLYALVIAGVSGVVLEQMAFSEGSLAAAMVPITLLNPVVATLLGLVAWHETLAAPPTAIAVGVCVGIVLAGAGAGLLSRSALLRPAPARVL